MKRKLIIIFSITAFIFGGLLVVANIAPLVTIIAFLISATGLYIFIIYRNGLYTGYMERLNTNFDQAIDAIEELFNSATKSIAILTGSFPQEIYFNDNVFEALRKAKQERNVNIDILIGEPEATITYVQEGINKRNLFLSWVRNGEVLVRVASEKERTHFIVVDGLHIRREEIHAPRKENEGMTKERRKAIISYLEPDLSQRYLDRFNYLFKKASCCLIPMKQ